MIESDLKTICDRCGEECSEGFEERAYNRDSETGYIDIETVCRQCNAEEKGLCEDCEREPTTHQYKTCGQLRSVCVDCYAAAHEPDDFSGEEDF